MSDLYQLPHKCRLHKEQIDELLSLLAVLKITIQKERVVTRLLDDTLGTDDFRGRYSLIDGVLQDSIVHALDELLEPDLSEGRKLSGYQIANYFLYQTSPSCCEISFGDRVFKVDDISGVRQYVYFLHGIEGGDI